MAADSRNVIDVGIRGLRRKLAACGGDDLDAVRRDLIDAVERTAEPAHASVWLRR